MDKLDHLIKALTDRVSSDNWQDVDLGSVDYEPGHGFWIIVGVSGIVKAESWNKQVVTSVFPAGPCHVKLRKIYRTGTTATDIKATW